MMRDSDLFIFILSVCIYLAPLALIINSNKTRGKEKNGWLLATLFFSWFGWLLYVATTKDNGKGKKAKPKK